MAIQDTIITEALGSNRAVELNETTGALTLLDEERGITLTPVQVLLLEGFLSENQRVIFLHAFVPVNEQFVKEV